MLEAEINFCAGYPAAAHNARPIAQNRHANSTPARSELPMALYRSIFGIKCVPQVRAESGALRSEEHTSELQSRLHLVCRLLLEKKKKHRQVTLQLTDRNRIIW